MKPARQVRVTLANNLQGRLLAGPMAVGWAPPTFVSRGKKWWAMPTLRCD
jgi:hypothetical protein